MKRLLSVWVLVVLSCNETKNDEIKSFIPGTYVKHIVNEFNAGNDTLIIRQMNDNLFRITRISVFNRIREGKRMPLARKKQIWTALYNKDEQALHETQKGKVIPFLPNKRTIMVGSSEYKKIKN